MKKMIVTILIALVVIAAAAFGVKALLFPSSNASPVSTDTPAVSEDVSPGQDENVGEEEVIVSTDNANPMKSYDNGMASFTYDSSKLYFAEEPSDNENGIPLTSFLQIDTTDVLPRLDIMPLTLDAPFPATTAESEWEDLAKSLILAYYSESAREAVNLAFKDTTVKVEGDTAKMYVSFTCILDDSAEYSLSGIVRLVSNADSAIITVAMCRNGDTIPSELYDTYMSVELH